MSIELMSLADMDPVLVEESRQLLRTLVAERYPGLDTSKVLDRLLIRPHAALYAAMRTEVDRLRRSSSLLAIALDPALADPDIVDKAMSNYFISRRAGQATRGSVALVFVTDSLVTIPAGSQFTYDGVTYSTESTWVATPDSTQLLSDRHVLLQPHASGGYWAAVPVVSATMGAYDVRTGAELASTSPVPGLDYAYAVANFTQGAAAESNQAMLARLITMVTPPTTASRHGLEQLVATQLPDAHTEVAGFGDVEMQRNRRAVLAVSSDGAADVYVRSQPLPNTDLIECRGTIRYTREDTGDGTAFMVQTLVDNQGHAGFYVAAGAYPVDTRIDPAALWRDGGALQDGITYDRARVVPTINGRTPDSATVQDLAFSAYQGISYVKVPVSRNIMNSVAPATVARYDRWAEYWRLVNQRATTTMSVEALAALDARLVEIVTLLGGAVGAEFVMDQSMWLWLVSMPGLYALQDFIGDAEQGGLGDILVKAPYPCFVRLALRVRYYRASGEPDIAAIQAAVSAVVNGLTTAADGLRLSSILSAVQAVIGAGGYVELPVTMRGQLLLPSGAEVWITGEDILAIPTTVGEGVTGRVSAFYLLPDNLSIEVQSV